MTEIEYAMIEALRRHEKCEDVRHREGGQVNVPEMRWALHPGDEHCHAIAPGDLHKSETLGYAEALCGAQLPAAGLKSAERPWGVLCLPCVIGATADLPDPGRTGTAQ